MTEHMLELQEVTKTFTGVDGRRVTALADLSLVVEPHEMICLVGRSGCGKTTTLRLIAGLERATRGRILLNGQPVQAPSAQRSVVFQRYALFPWRTVLANVAFGLEIQGVPKKKRLSLARQYLSVVGLAGQDDAFPAQLSGGMQQRVAVARALAANPDVLLMDEPFGALDAQTRAVLQQELIRIWKDDRKTVIFVTHDIQEAALLADRVVVMQGPPGRVQAIIPCDLPRPRDRNNPAFTALCEQIHLLLECVN